MKTLHLTFIDNASHGYLVVPKSTFSEIFKTPEDQALITGYSGIQYGDVLLEEDLDASTFIVKAKEAGYLVNPITEYRPHFECPKNYHPSRL